ncbi:MAG: hypothetical protein ACE5HA_01550 [Anaerolineae bacterium]
MEHEVLQSPGEQTSKGQRITVPAEVFPYSAGIVGGMIAGVFMAVAMAGWGGLTGMGVWFPVNLIAATVLRDLQSESLQMLAQFYPAGAVVGTLIHLGLSITLGFIFAMLLPTLPGPAFLWALVIGPTLWFIAQYLGLPLVNPRMEALVHIPSFAVSHIIYSLILGLFISRVTKIECCDPGTVGIRHMILGHGR